MVLLFVCSVALGQTSKTKPTTKTPQYVIHMVKFGETLTKIAKEYGVTVVSILNINPSLTEDNLHPEQMLRIPNTANKKILNYSDTNNELQPKVKKEQELVPRDTKYHTVLPGQTMYSISKLYVVKVEDIQKWNNLKDYNIKVGSQLIVSSNIGNKEELSVTKTETTPLAITEIPKQVADTQSQNNTANENPDVQASDNPSQKELSLIFKEKTVSGSIQTTKGTGAPMTTTLGAMENVYFAMHKTLNIGTIIKIKNLVNNKIIYAKVIGKLPETDENKHVIVRYSLGVKKDLQLQNGKCYVQIEYSN